jgi:PDZ domain
MMKLVSFWNRRPMFDFSFGLNVRPTVIRRREWMPLRLSLVGSLFVAGWVGSWDIASICAQYIERPAVTESGEAQIQVLRVHDENRGEQSRVRAGARVYKSQNDVEVKLIEVNPNQTGELNQGTYELQFSAGLETGDSTETTDRYWLGVSCSELPDWGKRQLRLQHGLIVEAIAEDSPAERDGLQPFDILLQVNEESLLSTDHLSTLVNDSRGAALRVQFLRDSQEQTNEITPRKKEPDRASQNHFVLSMADTTQSEDALFRLIQQMKGEGTIQADGSIDLTLLQPAMSIDGGEFQVLVQDSAVDKVDAKALAQLGSHHGLSIERLFSDKDFAKQIRVVVQETADPTAPKSDSHESAVIDPMSRQISYVFKVDGKTVPFFPATNFWHSAGENSRFGAFFAGPTNWTRPAMIDSKHVPNVVVARQPIVNANSEMLKQLQSDLHSLREENERLRVALKSVDELKTDLMKAQSDLQNLQKRLGVEANPATK